MMWNFGLIDVAVGGGLIRTALQMYAWGFSGLVLGASLFRIAKYFGIIDLKACSSLNEMQSNVLADQVRLDVSISQSIEHFLSVLSFENNYMSDDLSSEELGYFYESAEQLGLSYSQKNEKLAKLQIQMRDLRRLSKAINSLGVLGLFNEVTQISSNFRVLEREVNQELDVLNAVKPKFKFELFNIQIELSKKVLKPSTQVVREKVAQLDSIANKLIQIEEELKKKEYYFFELLISFFELLTNCVEEFWNFFTPKYHFYFKDWAYEIYEMRVKNYQLKSNRVDELDNLRFDTYCAFLSFVETVTELAGLEDPEALNLGLAEQKVASRLKYTDNKSGEVIDETDYLFNTSSKNAQRLNAAIERVKLGVVKPKTLE